MDKEFPVREFMREIMDVQAKAYRMVIEMLVNDVKSELRLLKTEVNDIKTSFQFSQRDIDEINVKLTGINEKSKRSLMWLKAPWETCERLLNKQTT